MIAVYGFWFLVSGSYRTLRTIVLKQVGNINNNNELKPDPSLLLNQLDPFDYHCSLNNKKQKTINQKPIPVICSYLPCWS